MSFRPTRRTGLICLMTGAALVLSLVSPGCLRPATAPLPSPSPGPGTTVINSDSLVTGQITALKQSGTGYPWEVSLRLVSSEDVNGLPNPTKDSVGEVITAGTDEDLSSFQLGEAITANIKLAGDVEHGIILNIYNIRPK